MDYEIWSNETDRCIAKFAYIMDADRFIKERVEREDGFKYWIERAFVRDAMHS